VPMRIANRTARRVEVMIERLRRLRMTSTTIAAKLDMAVSTVGAVLARLGLHRLSPLAPPEPPNRYCRRHPGELIHIDIKKLGRFRRPGHRVTGRGAPGPRLLTRAGCEYCQVAIDGTSRVAYGEVLVDQTAKTTVGFLERAVVWFAARGVDVERVMTDNGPNYRSKLHARTAKQLGIKHLFWRPYRPRTNGKAERFIQPCCANGPTPRSTAPANTAPEPSNRGCTSTITDDPTAPSDTKHPQAAYPQPPEQPARELHLAHRYHDEDAMRHVLQYLTDRQVSDERVK
jgi:transposase InsO family protein